jgi:hypothetical protein
MGDEIEGAMQQAPQPGRQFMRRLFGSGAATGAGLGVAAVTPEAGPPKIHALPARARCGVN